MAVFYFDTSAIVKRYHFEQGTEVTDVALGNRTPEDQFRTSFLTLLEVTSIRAPRVALTWTIGAGEFRYIGISAIARDILDL